LYEVCSSGRKDYQNSKICGDEATSKIPVLKMNGIIIGLNNSNLFILLTNRVKEHENIETPLLESDKLSVIQ
jgi:hypothetical protein